MAKNILIIEDDEFLLDLLFQKFSSEGFFTSKADNGLDGVKKVKETKPDLILLDILLLDKNGLEFDGFKVLSEIKKDPAVSPIPVIIFSNLDSKKEIEKGLKLGAADYLIKSQFTPDEIVEKVKKLL